METEHIIAVVGVLIAVITAIGVFLGPWCANRWQERKRIYSEAMTNHFQILNQDIIQPLIDDLGCLINDEGRICSRDANAIMGEYSNPFSTMISSGQYDCFRLHFPADSEVIRGCIDKLHGQNKTVEDFHKEIKTIVTESIELSLRDGGPPSFIYSTVPEDLRRALVQLGRNEKPGDDFRSLKIVDEGERFILIGGSKSYAVTRSESEARIIRDKLIELMDNNKLQAHALGVYNETERIVNYSLSIADGLKNMQQRYMRLGNRLEYIKACYICQDIKK